MFSKKILLIIFVMMCVGASAQTPSDSTWTPPGESPGFGGSNNDPATNAPSVPIDGIEIPLLITGLVVAFFVVRKKQKQAV